ncbi:MAG: type III pantothenate kinase [Bdellovibrionota bacterium]
MILALDVGNSQIHGGVFNEDKLKFQFRKTTNNENTSDELGTFFRVALRENGLDPQQVRHIAICSVVPDIIHSLRSACIKYFDIQPFVLQAGAKTGLNIKYRNQLEVGADRIANAIAATHLFPGKNVIVADFGTATTYCAVTKEKEYLGGLIMPGLRISMEALESNTAKLPAVEIAPPPEIVGRSTIESIQSGLYFGHLYAFKGITQHIRKQYFNNDGVVLVGTGGFSRLFEREKLKEKLFDALVPELVLIGLQRVLMINS